MKNLKDYIQGLMTEMEMSSEYSLRIMFWKGMLTGYLLGIFLMLLIIS